MSRLHGQWKPLRADKLQRLAGPLVYQKSYNTDHWTRIGGLWARRGGLISFIGLIGTFAGLYLAWIASPQQITAQLNTTEYISTDAWNVAISPERHIRISTPNPTKTSRKPPNRTMVANTSPQLGGAPVSRARPQLDGQGGDGEYASDGANSRVGDGSDLYLNNGGSIDLNGLGAPAGGDCGGCTTNNQIIAAKPSSRRGGGSGAGGSANSGGGVNGGSNGGGD